MRFKYLVFILLAAGLTINGLAYKFEDKKDWTFTVKPGGTFHFSTLRGDINVKSSGGDEVTINVIMMSDARIELKKDFFAVESSPESLKLSPYKAAQSAKVNFDIKIEVPEHLGNVEIITQNGEIYARGTFKKTNLKTLTGEIDFKGNFTAGDFSSVNGDVDVYVKGSLNGPVTAKSHNGSLRLELRSGSDFNVKGKTVTGGIRNEFRLKAKRQPMGVTITGSVKDGTHNILLNSTTGNIYLLRQ